MRISIFLDWPRDEDILLSFDFRQGKADEFWHWKMLAVIGEQGKLMGQSNGSDSDIGDGKSMAFLPPISAQQTGLARNFWRNRKETKRAEEKLCFSFFARPEAGVNFRDIN